MTDGVAVPQGRQTFFHPTTGDLLVAGSVYHYIPATDTPKDTWQDEGLTVLNTNPITLDGAGQCTIWGDGLYRQVLLDEDGNQLWDQVTGFVASGGGGSVTFATPAEVAALSDPTVVISPYALGASGVLGSSSPFFPKFTSLGGVGNGNPSNPVAGTDNAAAFATANADDSSRIWMNDGTFRTTGGIGLQKYYDGSGKIYDSPSGTVMPGRFTYLVTPPTQFATQGIGGWFAGETDFIEPEWFIIGADCRHSISDRYFEATTIPHNRWFTSYGGSSSVIAHLTVGAVPTDLTAVLNSVDGLSVGDEIGFASGYGATSFTDSPVISNINTGTKTITFSPALAGTYAIGAVVTKAPRVNNNFEYIKGVNYAAGDFGGSLVRVSQNYQPLAGQTHFFETSTVFQYGGDVGFSTGTSGTYATGWESQYADYGNDVAVIAQVDSFNRTNDTGARSVVWLGTFFKSEGTKPADVAHAVAGPWRIALDTVRADLTTFVTAGDNLNAAINTALGHRWIMNSTASTAGRGGSPTYGTFFGNTPGDMYIESGNDGNTDFIALRFAGGAGVRDARLRIRPTAIQMNQDVTMAKSLAIGTDFTLGATGQVIYGAASGNYTIFNNALGRLEVYAANVLVGHVP